MRQDIIEQYGDFVSSVEYSNLPEEVLNRARQLFSDFLATAVAGSTLPWTETFEDRIAHLRGSATILGRKQKAPPILAGFLNTAYSRCTELDDVHTASTVHPGSTVGAASLAAAEIAHANGRSLLEGVVCGYEVLLQLAYGLGAVSRARSGVLPKYASSLCGLFGATAAAARILKLNRDQVCDALSLAEGYASGLWVALTKGLAKTEPFVDHGQATQFGLTAASLASTGLTATRHITPGKEDDDFLVHWGGKDYHSPPAFGLGKGYLLLEVSLKTHSTCRCESGPLDAFLSLMRRHSILAEQIDKVTARTSQFAATIYGGPQDQKCNPASLTTAQLSLPIAIAVAAINGSASLKDFQKVFGESRDKVLDFARRVETQVDSSLEVARVKNPNVLPATVEILLKDGRKISQSIYYAKGDPENALSLPEFREKFVNLVGFVLAPEECERIFDLTQRIDDLTDIQDLTSLLGECR